MCPEEPPGEAKALGITHISKSNSFRPDHSTSYFQYANTVLEVFGADKFTVSSWASEGGVHRPCGGGCLVAYGFLMVTSCFRKVSYVFKADSL